MNWPCTAGTWPGRAGSPTPASPRSRLVPGLTAPGWCAALTGQVRRAAGSERARQASACRAPSCAKRRSVAAIHGRHQFRHELRAVDTADTAGQVVAVDRVPTANGVLAATLREGHRVG